MTSTPQPSAARAGRATGAMFVAVFGAAWLLVGARLADRMTPPVIAAVVAVAVAIFVFARRRYSANRAALDAVSGTPEARHRSRWFNLINIGQWVLILLAANILAHLHLQAWILPTIMFIVGLHFLPLARLLAYPPHLVTGSAIALLAAIYPFVAARGPESPIGCLGTGVVLWLSALYGLSQ